MWKIQNYCFVYNYMISTLYMTLYILKMKCHNNLYTKMLIWCLFIFKLNFVCDKSRCTFQLMWYYNQLVISIQIQNHRWKADLWPVLLNRFTLIHYINYFIYHFMLRPWSFVFIFTPPVCKMYMCNNQTIHNKCAFQRDSELFSFFCFRFWLK